MCLSLCKKIKYLRKIFDAYKNVNCSYKVMQFCQNERFFANISLTKPKQKKVENPVYKKRNEL